MTWPPLGQFEAFQRWSGRERRWGGGAGRVWFAGGVVEGLISTIDEHVAGPRPGRQSDTRPAAIGCVPWLTHRGVADRLAALSSCCVVVDKGAAHLVPATLRTAENGLMNVLAGLRERTPGGTPTVLGPYSPVPEFVVGPVRVVGMAGENRGKPLLHAKLLVLGWDMWGEDDFGSERHWFQPTSVWWGSANWTTASRSHLEMGAWSDDEALAREATDFLDALIGFSEPLTAASDVPTADLVSVEYDDAAMADAAWESRWDDVPDEE